MSLAVKLITIITSFFVTTSAWAETNSNYEFDWIYRIHSFKCQNDSNKIEVEWDTGKQKSFFIPNRITINGKDLDLQKAQPMANEADDVFLAFDKGKTIIPISLNEKENANRENFRKEVKIDGGRISVNCKATDSGMKFMRWRNVGGGQDVDDSDVGLNVAP